MGVSKNRGGTPKWLKIMENPIKMDDLGGFPHIFGSTPKSRPEAQIGPKRFGYCWMLGPKEWRLGESIGVGLSPQSDKGRDAKQNTPTNLGEVPVCFFSIDIYDKYCIYFDFGSRTIESRTFLPFALTTPWKMWQPQTKAKTIYSYESFDPRL